MTRRFAFATLLFAAPLAGVGWPSDLDAQYFGRNRVQYGRFDFKIIQTEHFDVYFYPAEREAALDIARMAERSYARLSRVLNHQFEERKPIIPYASHSDFQQTNTSGGEIDESTGGFTDFLRHRNIFPLTGSYEENQHVLQHEMVHQFQFDIWSRGRVGGGMQGIISANAPLWFGEGMAEYLSLGPVDPNTAMWLRDAAQEGKLPSPEDFYRWFPYRFGHALIAYVGGRWGDEAIAQITKLGSGGGIEAALPRVLGLSFEQLVAQWHDAVQKQYLPEIGNRTKGRAVAQELLTQKRSGGGWHLAPALSPDGSRIAYLSERNFYFVDLWLADGRTGKTDKRLLKSTYSGTYETFRFINSSASWSPDGKLLAIAAQRAGRDDIVIIDVARNKQVRAIRVPIAGVTNPTWSPDGQRIVFSGLDGGISDLYTVNADGSNFTRLTNDKDADLHPVWSPDGKTIAFSTDRGPGTDFQALTWGKQRIALFDVASGRITLPGGLDVGRNVDPQWSPDGKSIAFVSDRNGVANLYLYELGENQVYQLTDFYTGIQGIQPLSPVLSWAHAADRLAFVYFEQGRYDVYALDNPRSLKKQPWSPQQIAQRSLATIQPAIDLGGARAALQPPAGPQVLSGGAVYRTARGFRRADSLPAPSDSVRGIEPVSIARVMDSMAFTPPDTSEFTYKAYRAKLEPEYVARPTIGYTRDTFGQGLSGSTAIVLGDMLGNHQLGIAASLNGRINETFFLAQYVNLTRRLNWTVALTQQPYFYYDGASIEQVSPTEFFYIENIRRLVLREAQALAAYPFNRFRRLEFGASFVNVEDDERQLITPFDPVSGQQTADAFINNIDLGTFSFVQPSIALVFDNTLFGGVGPILGRRSRFEVSQRIGQWRFTTLNADYRRYDHLVGPFTLATRLQYFGQHGRDEQQFRLFAGYPELIRGYTSGSFQRNECSEQQTVTSGITGCAALDRLIGTRIALGSAELRWPLFFGARILPAGFPAIEGVAFYDALVAWEKNMKVRLSTDEGETVDQVRSPLTSVGVGVRANVLNFLILRADYAFPLQRRHADGSRVNGYWTLSLGPTF